MYVSDLSEGCLSVGVVWIEV